VTQKMDLYSAYGNQQSDAYRLMGIETYSLGRALRQIS
jgi:hypothetical protein